MGTPRKYFTEEERREAEKRYGREYYYRNQEERQRKSREYYYRNAEYVREQNKTRRKQAETNAHVLLSEMLSNAKKGAKKRNIEFKLTKEQLKQIFIESDGRCSLSGIPLSTKFHSPTKVSIDRIDSSKGYTIDNIQLVAKCINLAKSDLKQSEFIAMCKAVVAFNS